MGAIDGGDGTGTRRRGLRGSLARGRGVEEADAVAPPPETATSSVLRGTLAGPSGSEADPTDRSAAPPPHASAVPSPPLSAPPDLTAPRSWHPPNAPVGATGGGDPAPGRSARVKPGRRLRITGSIVLLIGIVVLGSLAGWWLRGRVTEPAPPVTKVTVKRPVINVSGASEDGAMPSLTGLSEADAREALFQFGLTAEEVTVELAPAAGQAGLVIGQDPAAGTAKPKEATIRVSKAAKVPKLVGASEAETRRQLGALGAQVTVESRYDASNPAEGTVLGSTPAEGEPLVDAITLVVSTPPSSVFAAQIEPVEGACGSTEAQVDGRRLEDVLTCSVSVGADEPEVQEWALNREITALRFSLGQDDEGETGFPVTARVYVDGTLVEEGTAEFGTTTPFDVAVQNALRVRIELSAPGGACCDTVSAVLVDAKFLGSPDAVDALVKASGD